MTSANPVISSWPDRFGGAVVAVTGAARGIGRAVAQRFVAEGAHVYALDIREDLLREAWGSVNEATWIATDITESASVNAAFEQIREKHGRLDSLVAAAGIADAPWRLEGEGTSNPDPTEIDDEAWNLVLNVNLTGSFYCVRAALPLIRAANGGGSIVTVSSVGALAPYPLAASYPAAKAGILGMTRALAALLGPERIRVNAVAPAATQTDMLPQDEELLATMVALQPIDRVVPPEEMAATIVYLCSDEAAFITGQTVNVNGGMVM